MFTERDLKMFKQSIADLEDNADAFYLKQYNNLINSEMTRDDIAKLAACFYTQKYNLLRKKKDHLESGDESNVVFTHPAYKSGITPQLVLDTYKQCGFNKCETARLLGVSIKTVYNRLRECGV